MTDIEEVRGRLHALLSETVLDGSDREVLNGAPLGEEGVGLDSLALVQFLTAVEQDFGAELPIEVWSDIAQLSLDDCATALGRRRAEMSRSMVAGSVAAGDG